MNKNFFTSINTNFINNREKILIEEENGKTWTCKEIQKLTAKFSTFFKNHGLKKGSKIIVQAEKSIHCVCIYLSCLKLGIIYVPLNTAYTSNEISYFIETIQPELIFFSEEKKREHEILLSTKPKIKKFILDKKNQKFIDEIVKLKEYYFIESIEEDDIASIIFTSGTTGKSKGAMLTHKNLQSNAEALVNIWEINHRDILIHALPIFHVHGLFVALNTILISGAKMIFFQKFSPDAIIEKLNEATLMMGIPTFYSRLLSNNNFNKKQCKNIRLFISGSAPLTEIIFHEFYSKIGQSILERYGMSEAGMISSNPLRGDRIAGTVGFALPNIEIRVCDESGKILPVNSRGNVEVKGPNVFRGYWQSEEKTKKELGSDGFFKTGDIGEIDSEGRLSLFGRSNDMIISGGYNIYPKEVELVLDEIDVIKESAVIGCKHDDLGEAVVAIIIPRDTKKSISDDKIKKILLKSLAGFKCPKKYIWLDKLPRNAMGKVQKKELKKNFNNIFKEGI